MSTCCLDEDLHADFDRKLTHAMINFTLASRMESTGVRGKIQVSEMTAHLLQKSGKEHWLEPREDMIKAKGKGRALWLL